MKRYSLTGSDTATPKSPSSDLHKVIRNTVAMPQTNIGATPTSSARGTQSTNNGTSRLQEQQAATPTKKQLDPKALSNNEAIQQDAVLFLRSLLAEAIGRGASDVHLEPKLEEYLIRFRIDGVLHTYTTRSMGEFRGLLNSLKVVADLDIAQHTVPQDGHIELVLQAMEKEAHTEKEAAAKKKKHMEDAARTGAPSAEGNYYYDIRVSVFPSVNGEVVVMRILNRANALLTVEELGMDPDVLEQLHKILLTSYGMILVTGPTGSGKTTTLYSVLSELRSDEKNIITLEDPIEFHLEWLRQCEINDERGFTFERAMSSVLRQDPDVLMVGEIRDPSTAEYAVRSALVGRIVGSTIHANTAIGTIARLLELGIPRSILAHTINGIVAQRLVRKVCENCREEYTPSNLHLSHLGLEDVTGTYHRGGGCDECDGSGFKGRTGLFSVMTFDDDLRTLILDLKPLVDIQNYAIGKGMRTLRMDAAAKVLAGVTTAEEAVRVV